MNNEFDTARLAVLLKDTDFIKNIVYSKRTGSTQTDAMNYAKDNGICNSVFITDRQITGRGRFSRSWFSTEKSLTFSVLFCPKITPSQIPFINYAAALAMKQVMSQIGLAAELKWPNDLLVRGQKICGILSETSKNQNKSFFVITGVGLNVNNAPSDFPREIAKSSTSFKIETGKNFSREKILADFIHYFEKQIELLQQSPVEFLALYSKYCDTLGQYVKVMSEDNETEGTAEKINLDGSILININGEKKSFFAADVVHLRKV